MDFSEQSRCRWKSRRAEKTLGIPGASAKLGVEGHGRIAANIAPSPEKVPIFLREKCPG